MKPERVNAEKMKDRKREESMCLNLVEERSYIRTNSTSPSHQPQPSGGEMQPEDMGVTTPVSQDSREPQEGSTAVIYSVSLPATIPDSEVCLFKICIRHVIRFCAGLFFTP